MRNNYIRRHLIICVVLCLGVIIGIREFGGNVWAQQEWEPTIRGFEQQDKVHSVPPGEIVFTGSSSIAYWSSLVHDMQPLKVTAVPHSLRIKSAPNRVSTKRRAAFR